MASLSLPTQSSSNGYTVIAKHKMDWGKFTDSNHIYSALGQNAFIDHLGLVTPFNQYGLVNTPLIDMTNRRKSILYLDNIEGKFRFTQPYKRGWPTIVDQYYTSTMEKPGLDGGRFKIKLTESFSNGDVLTTDPYRAPSLVVTEDEIYYEQDGYVHTVEVASQDRKHTYYQKKWLKPGSQYMKIDHVIEEYSSQGSSLTSQRLGWLELEANLGSGEKKVEHWITMHAHILAMSKEDKLRERIDKSFDLDKLGSILAFYNRGIDKRPIRGSLTWLNSLDAAVLSELMLMQETAATHGKGGEVRISGRKTAKLSLGLIEQLRGGNYIPYTRGRLNLPLIDSAIANLYRGTNIPIENRETWLDCGSGFLTEISQLIEMNALGKNIGVINSDQLGIISGKDPMNLRFGYRFTSMRFPNAGIVNFRLSPSLDNDYGLRNHDGLYGQYSDQSYSAMILDVTDSRSTNSAQKFNDADVRNLTDINKEANIYMVKPRAAAENYWGYIPGTVNPLGLTQSKGFMAASSRPGYGIFAYNFGNLWVKDPSRTLLIEIDK